MIGDRQWLRDDIRQQLMIGDRQQLMIGDRQQLMIGDRRLNAQTGRLEIGSNS